MDVLGRILELLSGMPLSELLARRVLAPLRMQDTAFWVPPEKRDRVADVLPTPPEGRRLLLDVSKQPKFEGGGGGLVSTAGDYARFLQMLLNGGELDDVRLLSPKSVALMTSNRLGSQVDALRHAVLPTAYGDRYLAGHVVEHRRHLYVPAGLGTAGLPLRLRRPPELPVLTLRAPAPRIPAA